MGSCDILQQTMEKEKRRVDEEKSNTSQIQKELVSLREKMEESEKKTEKLIHEMTAKEQLNINLQGQLDAKSKQLESTSWKKMLLWFQILLILTKCLCQRLLLTKNWTLDFLPMLIGVKHLL